MAADKCTGKCETPIVSTITGRTSTMSRSVLGCPKAWAEEAHGEHDWYSNKSGRTVHCYGAGPR